MKNMGPISRSVWYVKSSKLCRATPMQVNGGQTKSSNTSAILNQNQFVKNLAYNRDLKFKPIFQEPCLYLSQYEDMPVLVCHQSDEFMFGGETEAVLRRLCTALGKAVNLLVEPGLVKNYNGLKVV
jgi:hypothetical protein